MQEGNEGKGKNDKEENGGRRREMRDLSKVIGLASMG